MRGPVPESVRDFVLAYIDSVVQLEMLLLLMRGKKRWTATEVARELRIDPEGAAGQLAELTQKGLLTPTNSSAEMGYQYAPSSRRLRELMDGLERAYEDRRVSIISLIYSKPSDTIRVFADAFRIRKEDNEDG